MKTLIILCLTLSLNAFSMDNFKAIVFQGYCGELDPFYVGDVCLVELTRKSDEKKFSLIFDFDEFQEIYEEDAFTGKEVLVIGSLLSKISDFMALVTLRDFDSSYYYLEAQIGALVPVDKTNSQIEKFAKLIKHSFVASRLPDGYTAVKLTKFEVSESLKEYFRVNTPKKIKQWERYILSYYEGSDLSEEEINDLVYNPLRELKASYLLELNEQYKIYKDGEYIGQYLEINDHVQSQIYEDGAWIEMFLDQEGKIVYQINQSA